MNPPYLFFGKVSLFSHKLCKGFRARKYAYVRRGCEIYHVIRRRATPGFPSHTSKLTTNFHKDSSNAVSSCKMELNFGLLLLLSWVCPVFCILSSTSSGLLTLNLDTSSQEHPALGLTLPNLNATDADIAASSSVLPAQHSTNLTTTLKFGPDTVNIRPAANLKIVPTNYRDGVEICLACALVATLKAILDLTLQDWNEAIPKSKVYRRPKDHPDHTPSVTLGVIVIPNQSFRRSQAIYGLGKRCSGCS